MGKAYLIGHITVKDAAKWDEYRSRVPATMAPWGGELIFRGTLATVLSGGHASAAYQALIPLRHEAADVVLLAYDA